MIRQDRAINHKVMNFFHTVLLFGGMLLLLAVLGYLVAGADGIVWAVLLSLVLFVSSPTVSPKLMLRMYRARPLSTAEAPELYSIIRELSSRAGLPSVPALYYVPSQIMNAFTVGTRERAAIGITDGLLRTLSLRELIGVLAHEVSHIRNNDMKVMGLADIVSRLTGLLSTVGQVLLFVNLPLLLTGMATFSWAAIILLITAPSLSGLLQLALSRTREFDADLDAARLTGDPRGLASALQKLDTYKASILERIFLPGRNIPDPSIFRTHPSTLERVRRLLDLAEDESLFMDHELLDRFDMLSGIPRLRRKPRWYVSGLWY